MIVMRHLKTFILILIGLNRLMERLKHEIYLHEFIIKSNGSSADNKIKNEIEQLLLKDKHGNNIHRKQQNQ